MRPKPRRNPLTGDVRERVWERSGGRCEGCGALLVESGFGAWECHHRKRRSQGGRHELVNLLALGPFCCHDACTGNEAWAKDAGLVVASYADPADIPVLYRGRRLVFLTTSGEIEEAA